MFSIYSLSFCSFSDYLSIVQDHFTLFLSFILLIFINAYLYTGLKGPIIKWRLLFWLFIKIVGLSGLLIIGGGFFFSYYDTSAATAVDRIVGAPARTIIVQICSLFEPSGFLDSILKFMGYFNYLMLFSGVFFLIKFFLLLRKN